MAERVVFRGKLPSELGGLSDQQYLSMIKSRQRRSIRRGGLEYKRLIEKVQRSKASGKGKPIRTHTREAVILPSWVGMMFEVHNG